MSDITVSAVALSDSGHGIYVIMGGVVVGHVIVAGADPLGISCA